MLCFFYIACDVSITLAEQTSTIYKKLLITLAFLSALTKEEKIGTRSGRAGPSFSARPEKEAKGAVLHGTSAAGRLRHVKSCSANLPKLDDSHRLKHMERFVFAPAVRGRGKNPLTSHVERFCGRCREAEAAPSGPRPVYSGSGFELSSSVQWNISLKSLKHSGQIQ